MPERRTTTHGSKNRIAKPTSIVASISLNRHRRPELRGLPSKEHKSHKSTLAHNPCRRRPAACAPAGSPRSIGEEPALRERCAALSLHALHAGDGPRPHQLARRRVVSFLRALCALRKSVREATAAGRTTQARCTPATARPSLQAWLAYSRPLHVPPAPPPCSPPPEPCRTFTAEPVQGGDVD